MNETLFDKTALVNHVHSRIENMTNIRLQKTMYLLFAFYGATFGSMEKDKELDEFYPKYLFEPSFEAWRYGPVDNEIYRDFKSEVFSIAPFEPKTKEEINVLKFLDDLIVQTNAINDFGLVDRTHQDDAWRERYVEGEIHIKMDADEIIDEYLEKYVS
ncbi:gp24 [Brochothrix phage BL3]|uniref:gp24 n=1 Tax=Brochothrix phage BL3 TaxID=764562 RepID=UPI0001D9ADC1|nr:gp24 [Brochothrix phage BL3]ADH03105.1 gp24 [Brochothrix phage BL3]